VFVFLAQLAELFI